MFRLNDRITGALKIELRAKQRRSKAKAKLTRLKLVLRIGEDGAAAEDAVAKVRAELRGVAGGGARHRQRRRRLRHPRPGKACAGISHGVFGQRIWAQIGFGGRGRPLPPAEAPDRRTSSDTWHQTLKETEVPLRARRPAGAG